MLRNVILTACLLMSGPALAQSPPAGSPTNPTVPTVPPPAGPSTPPEQIAPSAGQGNLSKQLSQQKGTITPPNVDPGMSVSPPGNAASMTPVIPPPGTPGGNRSVAPK